MSNMPITLMEDAPPYLDFEVGLKEKRAESIATGRKVYEDVEKVIITPMGDNKTQVIKECDEWLAHLRERRHHQMISEKYLEFCESSYNNWKMKRKAPVSGTPIEAWPQVGPAEVKAILDANFRTVEDLARANDEGLGLIGMGARTLKKKATAYLLSAKKGGAASEKMNSLEIKLDTVIDEKQKMETKIAQLEAQLAAASATKSED
jgi:uncharacterized protein YqgV (UPF0045/DUF77 family)|tara:strand:- start:1098 stop:1715 length:618 start_codon:yes stop_codon:yes gene_type:complete